MSDIPTVDGLPQTLESSLQPQPTGSAELSGDSFLTLLTAQLQNQDPLEPIANHEFVAQLAQFSSLEQLVGMQDTMEAVYLGIASLNNSSMASLLGADVVAHGDTFAYDGEGGAELHFDAAGDYVGGTITIKDEAGEIAFTSTLEQSGSKGEDTWTWDGNDKDENPVDAGTYTFSITLDGPDDTTVGVQELVVGTISEMDYSTGVPQPSIDGASFDIQDIVRITREEPEPAP